MIDFIKQPRLDVFKSDLIREAFLSPTYEFPLVKRTDFIPVKAIPFDKTVRCSDFNRWVHFYIHDVQFQRLWNNPN